MEGWERASLDDWTIKLWDLNPNLGKKYLNWVEFLDIILLVSEDYLLVVGQIHPTHVETECSEYQKSILYTKGSKIWSPFQYELGKEGWVEGNLDAQAERQVDVVVKFLDIASIFC